MTIEFEAYGKTPRLFRDVIVTEKLDGTNSAIIFEPCPMNENLMALCDDENLFVDGPEGPSGCGIYHVGAQSRNRMIYVGKTTDNYGFAAWVQENAQELFDLLGPGRHYGEWWGNGIARGYNQETKRFSLFNHRHAANLGSGTMVGGKMVDITRTLYSGEFSDAAVLDTLRSLKENGSAHAPGFMNPEGIITYHTQSKQVYKTTLDKNDASKWEFSE